MSKLLPYETIVKAHEGDPDAIDTVLSHYAGYIRYFSKVHGQVNAEVEEYVKQQLIAALFKFRFDRSAPKLNTSRHRRPVKAVSLKKICCFFCCSFGKIAKLPVVGR